MNLDSLCSWSSPVEIKTPGGPRLLRTATPTESFWQLWRDNRDDLKNQGISVQRNGSEWVVCWVAWPIDPVEPEVKHIPVVKGELVVLNHQELHSVCERERAGEFRIIVMEVGAVVRDGKHKNGRPKFTRTKHGYTLIVSHPEKLLL